MGDPLFDTLFRSTAQPPRIASAAPVRAAGTRSRAGNAMDRTRAALLDGARRAVEVSGTRITMAQVAAAAGVAKATLYNHFRTRDAVLAALLTNEIEALIAGGRDRALPDALGQAATALSEHPLRSALADVEPATLAGLSRIDAAAEGWRSARAGVEAALTSAGCRGTDTVLRWLASYLVTPAAPPAIAADLEILLAGLSAAASPSAASSTLPAEPAGQALPA